MIQVYSFRTAIEAHDLRLFLESHGISAKVFGGDNAFEVGFAFTPSSAPGVFVDDENYARAQSFTEEFLASSGQERNTNKWCCTSCGEQNEASFEICWRCEAIRNDSLSHDSDPIALVPKESSEVDEPSKPISEAGSPQLTEKSRQPIWWLWLEVLIVLAVFQPFYIWTGHVISWLPKAAEEWLLSRWHIEFVIADLATLVVLFLIIKQGGERLSKFGLQGFDPLWDLLGGWTLMLITMSVLYIAADLFGHFLRAFPSLNEYLAINYNTNYESLSGIYGLVVFGYTAFCVGFTEELIFRGFMIPRFEEIFKSTPWAVTISAILFSTMHISQNLMGIWQTLIFGLIFGAVFVKYRRIWPLVVAHATLDFLVFLRDAR